MLPEIEDLMLVEVLKGFRSEADFKSAKSLLLDLTVFEIAGVECAIKAAENYRLLRSKGVTIRKTIDTLIATFCMEQSHPLLYADKDFEPFVTHFTLKSALAA